MRSSLALTVLAAALLLSSCKLFRKSQDIGFENLNRKSQFIRVYEESLKKGKYDWVVTSARIRFKSSDQNVSLSASIKSRKDSLVWLRMTKLLEVMRGQLSDQNFQMINRIDRTVHDYSYDDIGAFIDPEQGLAGLQSLLAGDVPFEPADADFEKTEDGYLLSVTDSIEQKAYLSAENLKMSRYEIYSQKDQTSAVALFSDYVKTDHGYYPRKIDVEIKGFDLEEISLEITKIEFRKHEQVDFIIPEGYKKGK